ncbi:transposase [Clostridium sp. 001]|uniref:transposase n=1 Tax=Clostridium sp. 001 TaxID=1970093 RepID=UPI0020B8F55C|nr:transposase [Clostridium sp. 001]
MVKRKSKTGYISEKTIYASEDCSNCVYKSKCIKDIMDRSIQAEGSFAEINQDMGFRRYLSKCKKNVLAESILLAMAHNINKLHNKIQSDRTGTHLFQLKKEA